MSRPSALFRVLFVADQIQWVTGGFARAVWRHHPWISPCLLSVHTAEACLLRDPDFFSRFDLVHFVVESPALAFEPRARARTATVATLTHVENWEQSVPLLEADAISVMSRQWLRCLEERGADTNKVHLFEYGIDLDRYTPAAPGDQAALRRHWGVPPGVILIGSAGKRSSNSSGRKDPATLVAALVAAHRRDPRIGAAILGPGWDDTVRELRSAGLFVLQPGYLDSPEDVAGIFRMFDQYWVTSRIEGGPLPLLEAMACGCPGLSTRVGFAPDIIRDGENGFLLEFGDVKGFAAAGLALAADPARAREMGRRAREAAEQQGNWVRNLRAIPDLYRCAQRRRAATPQLAAALTARGAGSPSADRLESLPPKLRRMVEFKEAAYWAYSLYLSDAITEGRGLSRTLVAGHPFHPSAWALWLLGPRIQPLSLLARRLRNIWNSQSLKAPMPSTPSG
jgi:glycosyltransferase involved in cell wall biosynthesis